MTKNTPLKPGMIAVSSLGFGGSNAHVILKSNPTPRRKSVTRAKKRLVLASGRTLEAVDYLLDGIQANRNDHEFLGLLDEIHKMNVDGHEYRG